MSDTYFLVIGIIISAIGLFILGIRLRMLVSCRERIDATVTGVSVESNVIRGSTVHSYHPKYSYTVDGKTYKGTAAFSSLRENKYNEGDVFRVYINPKNPELVRFSRHFGLFIAGLCITAFGALLVVSYFL